jgi:hypothetical protein
VQLCMFALCDVYGRLYKGSVWYGLHYQHLNVLHKETMNSSRAVLFLWPECFLLVQAEVDSVLQGMAQPSFIVMPCRTCVFCYKKCKLLT